MWFGTNHYKIRLENWQVRKVSMDNLYIKDITNIQKRDEGEVFLSNPITYQTKHLPNKTAEFDQPKSYNRSYTLDVITYV